MDIIIVDHTQAWEAALTVGCIRWEAALAGRGITVSYVRGSPSFVPVTGTPVDGLVHVTDAQPWPVGHWGDSWQWDSGAWPGGWVHLYQVPPGAEFAIAIVVHELGHVFGLKHREGASVMTPIPSLAYPTAVDAGQAMPGYPLPPLPVTPGKGKKPKKHKGKRGKSHKGKH